MSGDLKCTDSQAVLSLAAGVWSQSGWYIPAKHLMNPLSACLNIDQIEYQPKGWTLLFKGVQNLNSHMWSRYEAIQEHPLDKRSQEKDKQHWLTFWQYSIDKQTACLRSHLILFWTGDISTQNKLLDCILLCRNCCWIWLLALSCCLDMKWCLWVSGKCKHLLHMTNRKAEQPLWTYSDKHHQILKTSICCLVPFQKLVLNKMYIWHYTWEIYMNIECLDVRPMDWWFIRKPEL